MRTKLALTALAVTALLGSAGGASASPGAGSIASADGAWVYMVGPAPGGGGTIVTKIRGSDRTAQLKRRLPGSFEVPAIAGEKGGLSHDGDTLVLGGHVAHFTQFALLDTRTLRPRRILTLRGTYSFDALSPDASKLYVIRFFSTDGSRYAVQMLNLNRANAVPRTVVEKGEPGEAMAGRPVARTTGRDGDWVYTLYRRAGEAPFIHALSTAQTYTMCIDLDNLAQRSDVAAMTLKLRPGGHRLDVIAGGAPVASVNTGSFEVSTPLPAQPAASPKAQPKPQEPGNGGTPWWLIAGGAGLALAGAAATARHARTKHVQRSPSATQI